MSNNINNNDIEEENRLTIYRHKRADLIEEFRKQVSEEDFDKLVDLADNILEDLSAKDLSYDEILIIADYIQTLATFWKDIEID